MRLLLIAPLSIQIRRAGVQKKFGPERFRVFVQVLPLGARRSKLRIAVIGAAQHGGETQKHRRRMASLARAMRLY
jgi:hypothetical protein